MATLYNFRHEGCEIGIKIGSKAMRGQGYASEAVGLLVSYCFATNLNDKSLTARVCPAC